MQDFYIDGFRTVLFSISDCETRLTWVWMTHLIMHALFEFKQVCSIWDKFVHCYNVFHRYKIKCGIFEVDFTYIICNMSEIIWTNSFIFADFQSFSQSETKIANSRHVFSQIKTIWDFFVEEFLNIIPVKLCSNWPGSLRGGDQIVKCWWWLWWVNKWTMNDRHKKMTIAHMTMCVISGKD